MPYGTLALDTIDTSGNLAVTGNVTTTGTLRPSALRGTAANTPPVFQDSAGTQIGTLCRAWVNFNGTGTVAIRTAFNVSSITDNGTGDFTVNFTTAMPDANYVVSSGQQGALNTIATFVAMFAGPPNNLYTPTTSSFRISTWDYQGRSYDSSYTLLQIFR